MAFMVLTACIYPLVTARRLPVVWSARVCDSGKLFVPFGRPVTGAKWQPFTLRSRDTMASSTQGSSSAMGRALSGSRLPCQALQ